jgi:uncharacterized protein YukE
MEKLTTEELNIKLNEVKAEFDEYKNIIKQAYTEMTNCADMYELITKELKKRGVTNE